MTFFFLDVFSLLFFSFLFLSLFLSSFFLFSFLFSLSSFSFWGRTYTISLLFYFSLIFFFHLFSFFDQNSSCPLHYLFFFSFLSKTAKLITFTFSFFFFSYFFCCFVSPFLQPSPVGVKQHYFSFFQSFFLAFSFSQELQTSGARFPQLVALASVGFRCTWLSWCRVQLQVAELVVLGLVRRRWLVSGRAERLWDGGADETISISDGGRWQ